MKLIELLQQKDMYAQRTSNGVRVVEHIWFDNTNYAMSVQASRFHYCTPRQTLALTEYKTFEVLFDLPVNDILDEIKQLDVYSEQETLYANVPVELLEKQLIALEKKYGDAY